MRRFALLYIGLSGGAGAIVAFGTPTHMSIAGTVTFALAALGIIGGLYGHRPAQRTSWIVLGAAYSLFAVLEMTMAVFGHGIVSSEAFDALYLLGYLTLFGWAGCLMRAHGRLRGGGDRLDFLLILVAVLPPLHLLVLDPLVAGMPTLAAKAGALVHPMTVVVLLALVLRLAIGGSSSLSLRLLVASMGALGMANIFYVAGRAADPLAHPPHASFVLWWAGAVLAGLAALVPSMADVATRHPDDGRRSLAPARMVAIALALLTPTATGVVAHRLRDDTVSWAIIGPAAVMTGLLLLRLRGLFNDSDVARRQVEQKERYFRTLALSAADPVVVTDAAGIVVDLAPTFTQAFGDARPGVALADLVASTTILNLVPQARQPGATVVREASWSEDGTVRSFEVTVRNKLDDEAVGGLVWSFHDISERQRFTEQLRFQALHDSLTGLPNRVLLGDRLQTALARAQRSEKDVAAFFIDLDNFKSVNDALGHGAGDRLLVAVAARLRSAIRGSDTLSRLGGDEFAVVAEGLDRSGAEATARRLIEALAQPIDVLEDLQLPVTASIGVACGRPTDPELLLRQADVAMYRSKADGKAGYTIFEGDMDVPGAERLRTEMALTNAIEQDELFLVYQPIVGLTTDLIVGAEALLRWRHPDGTVAQPLTFLPIAEQCGLMIPIGRWVLHEACHEAMRWATPIDISVNVSPRHLESAMFVSDVRAALAESGLPASRLVLEITETTLVRDVTTTGVKLAELRALGVRFAVDDFGTGYSSLAQLRDLSVDILKIDRSFVSESVSSAAGGAMVTALLQMARALNLSTVAEGVEEEAQEAGLRAQHCEAAQGFYYAKPMTADRFQDLLLPKAELTQAR